MERPHLPWLHIPILSKIYTNAFSDLHERILQIYYIFKTCAVLITNYYGITISVISVTALTHKDLASLCY